MTSFAFCIGITLAAQVEIDNKIEFNSTDTLERQVEGLALPESEGALLSMDAARSGYVHWCTTSRLGDSLQLIPSIPISSLSNGALFRFIVDQINPEGLWLSLPGTNRHELVNQDGHSLNSNSLRAGEVVQVQWKDSLFYLQVAPPRTCPSGFLKASETMCIQAHHNSNVDWFQANEICDELGGRLCTWGEYIHACRTLQNDMTGLFDNWEWIDDTSDHTHTADQVGRWTCSSNRSRGATDQDIANFRCCYLLR